MPYLCHLRQFSVHTTQVDRVCELRACMTHYCLVSLICITSTWWEKKNCRNNQTCEERKKKILFFPLLMNSNYWIMKPIYFYYTYIWIISISILFWIIIAYIFILINYLNLTKLLNICFIFILLVHKKETFIYLSFYFYQMQAFVVFDYM